LLLVLLLLLLLLLLLGLEAVTELEPARGLLEDDDAGDDIISDDCDKDDITSCGTLAWGPTEVSLTLLSRTEASA
jgi:hypothetical protein